jgi:hypothetical protein
VRWDRARLPQTRRSKRPAHYTILLNLSWNTPPDSHPGALAFANPYAGAGASVTVFMDRLEPMAAHSPIASAFLLGHVLAHEMGHVLQGVTRHSATGVLKEHWSEMDIRTMGVERLRFTEHDAALILEGIRSRAAGK